MKNPSDEVNGGVDDAAAQLGQVLEQAHAGEFGALGDGGARAIDEINHGGGTRWARRPIRAQRGERRCCWRQGRPAVARLGSEATIGDCRRGDRRDFGGFRARRCGSGHRGCEGSARAHRRARRWGQNARRGGASRESSAGLSAAFCACCLGQLFAPLVILHVAQFFLNLKLELVAGAAKFGEQLADGASDFRQLLRAEEHQSQQEDEDGVAEMHE